MSTCVGVEWAIGVDEGEEPEVGHVTFAWSPEGNSIISTQAVTVKDTLVSRVTEWIGSGTQSVRRCAREVLREVAASAKKSA
jgi:hypothetical protein